MSEDKIRLNKEQKSAVEHGEGPLLIIAGAGTGKTTVITERIKQLVSTDKASPSEILALTFTEKASREMEERVDVAMPYGYTNMWISTFHSFCDQVLRDDGLAIGLDPSYKLMTSAESVRFLQSNLFEMDLKYFKPLGNPSKFVDALLTHFSRLQDEDVSPNQYSDWVKDKDQSAEGKDESENLEIEKWKELSDAYSKYTKIKIRENKMDFGDLIVWTLRLFCDRPNILSEYKKKFKYILVDEYQDTNISQNELVKMLAGENGNITVVADDDQAIYKWRGASVSNVVQFRDSFNKASVVTLIENYRSSQEILDGAYKMIQNNNPDRLEVVEKIDKKLKSNYKAIGEMKFIHTARSEQEAEEVAKKIIEIVDDDYSFGDVAILVRANNHAEQFVRALDRHGIPNKFLGPTRLFQEKEIIELVSYLKVLYDFDDSLSLYQVLGSDHIDIDSKDLIKLLNESRKMNLSLYEFLLGDDLPVSKETEVKISKIIELIKSHQSEMKEKTAGALLFDYLEKTDLIDLLVDPKTEDGERRAKNIAKLFEKVKAYEGENERADVFAVVDWIEMLTDYGESPLSADVDWSELDAVKIMTVHGSKGLEFPVVFLVNLVNQRFPSTNRREKIPIPDGLVKEILPNGDPHIQEERRLFYVGVTRAKEKLYLTAADYYGEGKRAKKISPFVFETVEDSDVISPDGNIEAIEKVEKVEVSYPPAKITVNYLSYSQINAFQTCPLHYKLRYIYKIPTETTPALSFGQSMHNALDRFFKSVKDGGKGNMKELEKYLEDSWEVRGYMNKKHEEEMYEKGLEYLREFHKSEFDVKKLPISLEQAFNINLPRENGMEPLKIAGKIDRIDDIGGGKIEIIDYKTGESVPTQKQVDSDMQLSIYALAATNISDLPFKKDIDDVTLSLYYFKDQVKISTKRTKEDLEKCVRELFEIRGEIEESDFKCSKNFFCGDCEFKQFCEKG